MAIVMEVPNRAAMTIIMEKYIVGSRDREWGLRLCKI